MRLLNTHRLIGLFAALVVGGLLVALLVLRARATPPPPAVSLQTASTAALAAAGIHLTEPTGAAKVDQASASKAAIAEYPGSTVRESILAQVDDQNSASPVHCLCWVVSIDPPDGFHFPSAGPADGSGKVSSPTYMIMIIDANTGQFLEGAAGQ